MSTPERLRLDMVEAMVAVGALRTRPWIEAFSDVPRHVFTRRFFRQSDDLSGWMAVAAEDPGAVELIYTDATWVTQLDNDPKRWHEARAVGEPVPGVPTSSSSAPSLMALMLEALDVRDGQRVLEVGTGTGYNAALLCHRLGSDRITTVEVDPVVAAEARSALRECGLDPAVVAADGAAGHAAAAPYDRLIATCSTPNVPSAWIAQVTAGGLILVSLHRDLGGGPLVLLRVDGQGRAVGRFLADYGGFMPVRAHPLADAADRLAAALAAGADGDYRAVTVGADVLDSNDFGMMAALRLPGVTSIGFVPETGQQRWLLSGDGSWARLDGNSGTVAQHRRRRLWDEVEALHREWVQLGSPARERLGLTVTDTGEHRFWLDDPQVPWWTEGANS